MAVVKVCGTETEYGIQTIGMPDTNPIAASSMLVNAYVADVKRRAAWDFDDESPGRDARGYARKGSAAPDIETHLANAVLTDGARYYVDHAHPELSTPECSTAMELVCFDKAGELILERSMEAASRVLDPGQEIVVYKNNSDGKGNSYGCHENYLMDRSVPFARIAHQVTSHFVTRIIFAGAGKVGSEGPGSSAGTITFQLSQRADFFEEEIGLETTLKRPIVNTRDEPHADPRRFRRLHVIVGDANCAEVATFLKVGTTSIVLAMIEDDFLSSTGSDLTLASPVRAIREVSRDLGLSKPLDMATGRQMTAMEVQWELLRLGRKYAEDRGLECVGGSDPGGAILDRWEDVLNGLESDPASLARQLDWVAKKQLIDAYRERHGLPWTSKRLAALDLQYHDLRPERSLFRRLDTEHLVAEEDVERAVYEPPETTRAYFRGRCLERFAPWIASANWDSLVFDLGSDPLRRVPMMDPLKGTAAHVAALLDECETPQQLIERLGA